MNCNKKEFPGKKKPIYHYSIPSSADSHVTKTIEQEHKIASSHTDLKRNELVHKEEKSFWRSWFGIGSSYDYDSDSDEEKRKNSLKFNKTHSNRPGGPKLSTRKSSAERQTNFNAPTEEERAEAKLAKRSASVREVR